MAVSSVRSQALGMLAVGGGAITAHVPKKPPSCQAGAPSGLVFSSPRYLMTRLFNLCKFPVQAGDPRGEAIN